MAKTSAPLHHYARMGALTRITELQSEIETIERTFPELSGRSRSTRRTAPPASVSYTDEGQTARPEEATSRTRRRRKPMTAAQRKAVGERMRKYWAARKSAKK